MPISRDGSSTANVTQNHQDNTVVDLAGFRCQVTVNPVRSSREPASMLSMRRHLAYQASVEIDKLEAVQSDVAKKVRALLNREFGKLRVHRYRRLFVIRHRSVEGLISCLLRVQFHAHQLELPLVNKSGEVVQSKPITLTWGVGRTTTEAEVERLRRRRQKFKR